MNPVWRERLVAAAAALLAVWLSFGLADGALGWPLVAFAVAGAAILVRGAGLPLDALALGLLVFGYIVGNRGFAQLMPVPGVPLLPAEIGLALAGAWLAVRCAQAKVLPWRPDALNYALLAWIVLGTGRIVFDLPRHGFLALRDYAAVYYVAFFFVTQHLAQEARVRKFLLGCFIAASVCLPPVFALFELFPDFFLGTLTLRGIPLIFFKGDLAPLFMAVGAVLLYLRAQGGHRLWARPLATGLVVWVAVGENRAALLGLIVAFGWIGLSRYRAFPAVQAALAALVLSGLVAATQIGDFPRLERRLAELGDRAQSLVDWSGRGAYRQEHGSIKSDNNQFRWVWWRSVATETLAQNPVLGLGFGHDLAHGFLQEYNPDMAEEFTARSPHSVVVTALGRLGLAGVAVLGWCGLILARRTWRAMRDPAGDAMQVALWAALWPIAISACLGVVLEGPMGAVIFWTLLGLAHTYRPETADGVEAEISGREPAAAAADLQPAGLGTSR